MNMRNRIIPTMMAMVAACPIFACSIDGGFNSALADTGFRVPPEWIFELPPKIQPVALAKWQETPAPAAAPAPNLDAEDEQYYSNLDPKHRKDLIDDVKLGRSVVVEVNKELKLSSSTNMTDRVTRIGAEFAAIANANQVDVSWGDKRLNPFRYTFKVVEGKDVNAFSLPGGFIYIYEGLIKYAETDHELAGVIAHEVAHASFRHVATLQREQSKLSAITLPLILIGLLTGSEAGMGIAQAGTLANQAIGSGWSVKAEKSADLGGFQYMRKSNYEAVGLLTFMERLAFDERGVGRVDWGIYKSHPPSRERVNSFISMMQGASQRVQRSISSTTLRAIPVEETDGSHSLRLMNRKILTLSGESAANRIQVFATKLNSTFDAIPSVFDIESRNAGEITGRGEVLVELSESDAERNQLSLRDLTDEVVRSLKAAAFELKYRVWDN